jgi:hypothetical protein
VSRPSIDPKNPVPGVYADLPSDVYHNIKAASNSRLSLLKRSPAHLRYELDNPQPKSPALALGEAAHLCILQPDLFTGRYVVPPDCDRRTKDGKATWAAFCADNAGRELLAADDHGRCRAIREAVMAHPFARKLLAAAGETELSAVWDDPASGVRCKMRADKVAQDWLTLVDLKTTRDASPDAFEKAIYNFGYHRQGGMYLDGMARNDRVYECYAIIAVETDPPHGVAVYQLDDAALEMGTAELRPLLAKYAECERSGQWGGYPTDIQWISVPARALSKHGRQGGILAEAV